MVAYHQPTSLAEALRLKAELPLKVLAGATDIYPARASRAGWGQMSHPDVLDISRVPGLRGILRGSGGWRIGTLTTWTDIAGAELPPLFDGLKAAAREIGGIQIQNRGTLGGNICNASPAADGVPCLLTLQASVEIASRGGVRVVRIAEFIDGYRHTALAPDEIVTAILVPDTTGRGAFVKLGARKHLVISIVMAAGVLDVRPDGLIRDARIAVGACSPVALRLAELEHALAGRAIADAPGLLTAGHLALLAPIDDVRASAHYRRHAAAELVRNLLASFAAGRRAAA
jgi:N-methylhydantoinase B